MCAKKRDDDMSDVDMNNDIDTSTSVQSVQKSGVSKMATAAAIAVPIGIITTVVVQQGGPAEFLEAAKEFIASAGDAGPAYFVLAYIIATVALLPASVLTLAAGYLYGPAYGTAIVSLASTSAAAAAFLISRYLARPLVEGYMSKTPKFALIQKAISAEGVRIVFLLRLSPLIPFNISNYLYGLTRVPFAPYVAASWAGMLPGECSLNVP